jgi:RNA polymerase sigma factor (sigma-70 family)
LPSAAANTTTDVNELPELTSIVRRVVAARVVDPDTVDDLVQETLARVLEARPRLEPEALTPYAIVTAQNLVRSLARSESTRKRHAHRLLELQEPVRPEDETVRKEEAAAVTEALARLPATERETVVAHEIGGVDTATLARRLDSSPGGVAVKLARARAKLRVEYVMALRRAEPRTPLCRPVLIALSGGDRRRQVALNAGEHLLQCRYCAQLSEPLVERRRSLAAFAPVAALAKLTTALRHAARSGKVQAATAATAVATAGVVALAAHHAPAPAPSSPPVSSPAALETENGRNLLRLPTAELERYVGRSVDGHRIKVSEVSADEGFWIDAGGGSRIWVQFDHRWESAVHVRAGDVVSFHGKIVRNRPDFAERVGLSASEGAAEVKREGYHVVVHKLIIGK